MVGTNCAGPVGTMYQPTPELDLCFFLVVLLTEISFRLTLTCETLKESRKEAKLLRMLW